MIRVNRSLSHIIGKEILEHLDFKIEKNDIFIKAFDGGCEAHAAKPGHSKANANNETLGLIE